MSTVYENTSFTAGDAWGGHTERIIIPAAALAVSASKLTLKLGYYDANWTFDKIYIGHAASSGDAYDFDGTQVQVLFSGVAGGTVTSGGLTSDIITYDLDESKNIVIAVYLGSATTVPALIPGLQGESTYYKSGDDAATTDAGGYTSLGARIEMVYGIYGGSEVLADFTDTVTMTDTMDGDSWTRDISDTATMTDTMSAISTLNVSMSNTATMTDTMEPYHLVESITEIATMTDIMIGYVGNDIRRRRYKVNW